MFVDTAKIKVKAGNGGDGAVAFHREKYVASGGPDGGDGGKGGSIIFVVSPHMSTLADFRYKRKYEAQRGEDGKGDRRSGKNGSDLIIEVPMGTVVRDAATGRIIADMSDDQPKVIAKGGKGGWGNNHFATPTRQAPRFSKPGMLGEEFELQLELKLLADVGVVGFPNVGKSSLISVVSEAKPAIGNYHFTTLTPTLGVVRRGEENSFVMADIPGLIEGASEGAGLGHQFLRHVDRCRVLVHMVDVSGSEGRDPIEDFDTINRELEKFNPQMMERPMIVAGNKIDLADDEQQARFEQFCKERGYAYYPMMAAINVGVEPMLERITELLATLPPIERYLPEEAPVPSAEELNGKPFTVREEDGVYIVEGEWLLNIMRSINFTDYESLQYFERVLQSSGIIDALRQAGIKERDTVSIYDVEFDFVN
ncbi:MAG: GTPase ObgE [Ruminococcaceae bacterium]|nr:GTPase ObgE [Oscillospiraceae bacterium]